jgi:hypothetical protein
VLDRVFAAVEISTLRQFSPSIRFVSAAIEEDAIPLGGAALVLSQISLGIGELADWMLPAADEPTR